MINSGRRQPKTQSDNVADFRTAFLGHVHELLLLGYKRMNASAFAKEDEPAISGELVSGINAVLDDVKSESWVDFFSVHDDPGVNNGKRRGKLRKRIDIRMDSSECRPRRRFSFEAKRLGNKNTVGRYLGADGLGRFLEGHYAANEFDAGMLGYVQEGSPEEWASEIKSQLESEGNPYALLSECRLRPHGFPRVPVCSYYSAHMRGKLGRMIDMYHTLLVFH